MKLFTTIVGCLLFSALAFGQANGHLQIHFIDVGQGDGALLISPKGEVALFDAGEDLKRKDCTKEIAYLDSLHITKIDYLFVSHYHFDHIGCIPDVLEQFPLQHDAYDRGQSYPGATYTAYVAAVKGHRKTATNTSTVELDKGSGHSVIVAIKAVNGAGVKTDNENDLSLDALISFDRFRAEIGGDLSGDNTDMYADIETNVAPLIGVLDVYKVHHHCSSHSTNETWLKDTAPTIGIISTGDNNSYSHPTADCLDRLHQVGVKTYWTERGAGATPDSGFDDVVGNVLVDVAPGASSYGVLAGGIQLATYPIKAPAPAGTSEAAAAPKYAWSKNSTVYHLADCKQVQTIKAENLVTGDQPPASKTLHTKCPLH